MFVKNTHIMLGIILALAAFSPLDAMTPEVLNELNILTFSPQPYDQKFDKGTNSFEPISSALKNGQRAQLNNTVAQLQNKTVNLSTQLPENHAGTIYLYVPPCMSEKDKYPYPERGAYEIYSAFKKDVIAQGVGVSYCPPNQDRKKVNFGQEEDQATISMFVNELNQRNPQSKIVLMSVCTGATGVMNTLSGSQISGNAQQKIDAAILQSPAISGKKVFQDISHNNLPWLLTYNLKFLSPLAKVLVPRMAPLYFTNIKADKPEEEILDSYQHIPSHVGFMIGALQHDSATPIESVRKVEKSLNDKGYDVTFFQSSDQTIEHGHLAARSLEYQNAIKQFLAKRQLDHLSK